MSIKEIQRAFAFSQDLVNIFTDYSFSLDKYFSYQENISNNPELYHEYMILKQNIINTMKKRGFKR